MIALRSPSDRPPIAAQDGSKQATDRALEGGLISKGKLQPLSKEQAEAVALQQADLQRGRQEAKERIEQQRREAAQEAHEAEMVKLRAAEAAELAKLQASGMRRATWHA